MGVSAGPQLVTNGLILHLDIANRRSFLDSGGSQRSLLSTSTWSLGGGGVTGYAANGNTGENERLVSTDPWGVDTVVWETRPSGDGNADGGWEGSFFNIDNTKLYRSSVWMRRTSSSAGGTAYHGLHTNGSGDTLRLSDSGSETNPYWDYRGTGSYTQNVWYLHVGHIYPANTSRTIAHPTSGIYTIDGGTTPVASNGGNVPSDVKFPTNATQAYQRVYHYYCGDNTTRLHFAYPRWDLVDGNEPTILELLSNSPTQFKDLSGQGNHHTLVPYFIPSNENPRKFNFNETTSLQRLSSLNGVSSSCTVVMYYSTTDTQELWVRGNSSGSVYLSASYGNNYYHDSCGTPTNYVDLATVTNPATPVNYRNGTYHMWEAKNVNFSSWTTFDWFGYGTSWNIVGNVSAILVYNRSISADESAQNFYALRSRYGI